MAASRAPSARRPAPPPTVRWDRIGRMAMLGVLMVIVYLYVGAMRSYLATHHEAGRRQALIGRLERANSELRSRRTALRSPATLARDARALGMIRPGERAYVVTGLPSRVTPTP